MSASPTPPWTLMIHGGAGVLTRETVSTATGSIMRSQFGLGMATPVVSDKVDLTIKAAFVAA